MTHNDPRYEFGPYELNRSNRILTRDGDGFPSPKATEILPLLLKESEQHLLRSKRCFNSFEDSVKLRQTRLLLASISIRNRWRCGHEATAGTPKLRRISKRLLE